MVDDVEQNHNENSYTHVVVGNYYRTLSQFGKQLKEDYNKLENFQDQGVRNLYTANHYRALANTFKGDFSAAEEFLEKCRAWKSVWCIHMASTDVLI